MGIKVLCNCGKILNIPDSIRGKKGRCPNCSKSIKIPSNEEKLLDLQSEGQNKNAYSPEDLYDRVGESVVGIETTAGSGSGFLLDSNGIIATNRHVIGTDHEVRVWLKDRIEFIGKTITSYRDIDLAFVKADLPLNKPVVLGKLDRLRVGATVYAIGHPCGYYHTLTKGIVSACGRLIRGFRYIQTDAAINSGNSGGPLFNEHGEVVGINTWGFGNSDSLNFAITVDDLQDRYKTIVDDLTGILQKHYCGVCGQNNTSPKYCENCGANIITHKSILGPLKSEGTANSKKTSCDICKNTVRSSDKYCSKCGSTIYGGPNDAVNGRLQGPN